MNPSDIAYRALLPEMLGLYEALFVNAGPVRPTAECRRVAHVIHAWFMRCQRGIEAVLLLDDAGFVVESAPIRRSVLEHVIALAWMVENPEIGWRVMIRGGSAAAIKRKESIERAGWTAVDLAAFDDVIAEGDDIDASTDYQLHFRQRCEMVGTPHDWAAYLIETAQSHPGWQSAVPYLELNQETADVTFRGQPFDDMNVGQWAAGHLFQALTAMNAALEGERLKTDLDGLQKRLLPLVIQARQERGLPIPDYLQAE